MRSKHFFFSLFVVVVLTIFMAGQAFAGGGGMDPLPTTGTVVGPAVWGTVVLTCSGDDVALISIRAKKIVDCDVETEAKMANLLDGSTPLTLECPLSAADIVNNYLPGLDIFEKPFPVITKAKNFVNDLAGSGTISFDAQIKFWVP